MSVCENSNNPTEDKCCGSTDGVEKRRLNFCEAVGQLMMVGAVNDLLACEVGNCDISMKPVEEIADELIRKELRRVTKWRLTMSFEVDVFR